MTNEKQNKLFGKTQQEISQKLKVAEETKKLMPTWNKTENKQFVGKYVKTKDIMVDGDNRQLAEFVTDTGESMGVWLNSVLQNCFKDLDVKQDNVIAIEYLGEVKSKSNPKWKYDNYTCVVL